MADDAVDETPQDRTFAGGFNVPLQNFVGQTGAEPGDLNHTMAEKVQDYLTLKAHTDAANAAEQNYTQGFALAKNNLVRMVQGDPMSTPLALSLAPDIVHSFTQHHGNEDERAAAHADLTGHIQNAIAHTAIQAMAERSPEAARAGLEKYGEHLTDADTASLNSYINNQADLQRVDNLAGHVQMAKQLVAQNHALTGNYLSGLTNPSGDIQFPPGWGQKMMGDQRLAPESKAALHGAYTRLVGNGDALQSDPDVLVSTLNRLAAPSHDPDHPMAPELVDQVGRGLTMADASHLMGMVGPQESRQRQEVQDLAGAMLDAKDAIGNRSAFARFSDWFMPAVRNAQEAGAPMNEILDPEKGLMARLGSFMPTGDDLIAPVLAARTGPRPSLAGIFGGAKTPDESSDRAFAFNQTDNVLGPMSDDSGIYARGKSAIPEPNGGDQVIGREKVAPVAMPRRTPADVMQMKSDRGDNPEVNI